MFSPMVCDGETIGLTAKETLWGQLLLGSATTTHAIRDHLPLTHWASVH